MNAAEFNARFDIGIPVFAYPGARREDIPSARRLVTRTRSEATRLGGHTDVVWVDGHSGCIALTHIDVVTEDEWQAAKAAEETVKAVKGDFFQPGRTYAHDVYRFQCEYLAKHPVYGHTDAWGWFGRNGAWRHTSFGRSQFEARDWADVTEEVAA
ncbi:hypothetical protein ACFWPQ_02120 [Streptomyces sp. NPDC058464]|uniref:hypothetical protein n=1 Tax=Streptomyces sp. NPDC058464 TaxID=3346511 RepID=UPI0036463B5C